MNGKKLMMAAAGGGGPSIEYIGSVTKGARYDFYWDQYEPANVLSVAQAGDLVVMAVTATRNTSFEPFIFGGMSFQTSNQWFNVNDNMHGQVGFRIVQSGDSNPYLTAPSDRSQAITAVFSVFRGLTAFSTPTKIYANQGNVDPPSLTAAGDLWIATAHLDDRNQSTWTAPSGYTLAAFKAEQWGSTYINDKSSTALAYKIETLTSDNPSAFSAGNNGAYVAFTLAASAA